MNANLIEVAECLVQVGMHASRWFVGDLDRRLEYSLRNDVRLRCGCRFRAYKHTEIFVAFGCRLLQLLLQRVQPACHQMYVLQLVHTQIYSQFSLVQFKNWLVPGQSTTIKLELSGNKKSIKFNQRP